MTSYICNMGSQETQLTIGTVNQSVHATVRCFSPTCMRQIAACRCNNFNHISMTCRKKVYPHVAQTGNYALALSRDLFKLA